MTEELSLFSSPAVEARTGAQALPVARLPRLVPLRAGILNLWQYDDQEFRFHQGRLLLRGDNGTGKSKALELLLPFLLDADLSPHRLDPFAGTARNMSWNLLGEQEHESRVGYVWMELGRQAREDEESDVYWTIGCGLRATRGAGRVDSWYFVTRQRIGLELELMTPDKVPLLRDGLARALGESGSLYDTGREYRDRLDKLFFRLGEDRFAALRHLLLQLRRPQLSQKLDPASLSTLLAESLPPVDPERINRLSEGFERIETQKQELQRVVAAARQVEDFLAVYRSYVRGIARDRAARVRKADSQYHKTASTVRDATADTERLEAELQRNASQRRACDQEIAASQGRLRALEQSAAMRTAVTLNTKRERAQDLARFAERAGEDRDRAERQAEQRAEEHQAAVMAERQARESTDRRLHHAATTATTARLAPLWSEVEAALPRDLETAQSTFRAAASQRRADLEQLGELTVESERAETRWRRLEERRQDAHARWASATERLDSLRQAVETHQRRLASALEEWLGDLDELRTDETSDGTLQTLIRQIVEEGREPTAVATAWAAPRRDELVRRRTRLRTEIEQRDAERAETLAERDRVEAAEEQGPPPPATRTADRTGRPGAPFYLLVDFRSSDDKPAAGEDEQMRAGLEAALEAAGLLDAWVTPDGRLLDPTILDTAFVPETAEPPRRDGPHLADLLVPTPGHGIERDAIERLLASIRLQTLEPDGTSALCAPSAVSLDGRWRLGPLQGRWTKPQPEHIGASAREAARLRRLAVLDRRLEEIRQALAALEAQSTTLDSRLAVLESEVDAVPSAEDLRDARSRAGVAGQDVEDRRRELESARDAAETARQTLEDAKRKLHRRGLEAGLQDHLGELSTLEQALGTLETAFDRLSDAWKLSLEAASRAQLAESRRQEAEAEVRRARDHLRDSERHATAARTEFETLEETAGDEASEVMEKQRRETQRLEDFEQQARQRIAEREELIDLRAAARTRLEHQQSAFEEIDGTRERAVDLLRGLAAEGFVELVWTGGPDTGEDDTAEVVPGVDPELPEEPPDSWSLTRTLDVAREIERLTADVSLDGEAFDRRANHLYRSYQRLGDLGPDFQPSLDQRDEVSVVQVIYNGVEHTPSNLLEVLQQGADSRRAALEEDERKQLQTFLLGDMGRHLRDRLRQATELVETMNDLLAACHTASGMVLRLAWKPGGADASETRKVMDLLRRDLSLLSLAERDQLEGFFLDKIEASRQQLEHVPWRDHLLQVLDYRHWYEFRIERRDRGDTQWKLLTRKAHEASSGGEKAVALHLPLFAAAAAHYESALPEAPRLVMLDEAFAGIDQGMRGRCMELLVKFDLDFMVTSHDEWGCYEELPGLAIYQLYRAPGLPGIGAVRFVWDGGELQETDGDTTRGVAS